LDEQDVTTSTIFYLLEALTMLFLFKLFIYSVFNMWKKCRIIFFCYVFVTFIGQLGNMAQLGGTERRISIVFSADGGGGSERERVLMV